MMEGMGWKEWDGMEGMGWDGRNGMGWKGMGWKGMGRNGMEGMGWKEWDGRNGMEGMGGKEWEGRNGMEGMGWKEWDGRNGMNELKKMKELKELLKELGVNWDWVGTGTLGAGVSVGKWTLSERFERTLRNETNGGMNELVMNWE